MEITLRFDQDEVELITLALGKLAKENRLSGGGKEIAKRITIKMMSAVVRATLSEAERAKLHSEGSLQVVIDVDDDMIRMMDQTYEDSHNRLLVDGPDTQAQD